MSYIEDELFGKLEDEEVFLFTLKNNNGIEVKIMNYGGIVVSLNVPDRFGNFADIVLGYDTFKEYLQDTSYFGAIVGRYANRICEGKFTLNGKMYQLPVNEGKNHLHGGIKGFNKVVWSAETLDTVNPAIKLSYLSKDGEEGYPGNLSVLVKYTLTDANELKIDYQATTDKPTIINLSHHSYFNLNGAGNNSILDHELMINADYFTPINENLIPTGEIKAVENTVMDFRKPTAIGKRINENDEQLKFGLGYDHNWVLNHYDGNIRPAVQLYEPKSGRLMKVLTTEPGMQFYSGNFLDGTITGKNNKRYEYRGAVVLEGQHFPDSPNHKNFPSVVLKPGEIYKQTTVYQFQAD